jgi:hypothetical protein
MLPKTFQEAIIFARNIGIAYIWIDSLCIIQDSKDDWLNQSGKMAQIYEHSTITLAASSAENCSVGCFSVAPPLIRGCVTDGNVLVAVDAAKEDVQGLIRKMDFHHPVVYARLHPPHDWHREYEYSPLLKRGWVYQERLLSPRMLHFGQMELMLECNQQAICYCGQHNQQLDSELFRAASDRRLRTKSLHALCLQNNPNGDALSVRWSKMIEEYSGLGLTVPTDRFVAIAGIAKQFRRGLNDARYMAGLWEESIVSGITWRRNGPAAYNHSRAPVAAVPTWSWMSVAVPITYDNSDSIKQRPTNGPVLKRTDFNHDMDREYTSLWGGSITLHGRLVAVEQRLLILKSGPFRRFAISRPGAMNYIPVTLDFVPTDEDIDREWSTVRRSEKLLKALSDWSRCYHDEPGQYSLILWDEHVATKRFMRNWHCLYMGTRKGPDSHRPLSELFLLLDCKDEQKQIYTRLGMVYCTPDEAKSLLAEETQDVTIV